MGGSHRRARTTAAAVAASGLSTRRRRPRSSAANPSSSAEEQLSEIQALLLALAQQLPGLATTPAPGTTAPPSVESFNEALASSPKALPPGLAPALLEAVSAHGAARCWLRQRTRHRDARHRRLMRGPLQC